MDAPSIAPDRHLRRPIMVVGDGAFGTDATGGPLEDQWLAPVRVLSALPA